MRHRVDWAGRCRGQPDGQAGQHGSIRRCSTWMTSRTYSIAQDVIAGRTVALRQQVSEAAMISPTTRRRCPIERAIQLTESRIGARRSRGAVEQADEADEAFGGTVARMEVPPHARAGRVGRGHRFRSLSAVLN